jgi:hypothetical protein
VTWEDGEFDPVFGSLLIPISRVSLRARRTAGSHQLVSAAPSRSHDDAAGGDGG